MTDPRGSTGAMTALAWILIFERSGRMQHRDAWAADTPASPGPADA